MNVATTNHHHTANMQIIYRININTTSDSCNHKTCTTQQVIGETVRFSLNYILVGLVLMNKTTSTTHNTGFALAPLDGTHRLQ